MNLEQLFCPNIDCPARGQVGQGNIGSHSQKEKRCLCKECGKSFTVTKGTLFYRLRTDPKTVMCVIVLLANGCPLQAVVKAFGFDERTVKSWWLRAGTQCAGVHNHLIGQSRLDLQQVQADEIKAKVQGGYLWLAMAIMVPTRLWLGGVISPRRDKVLIQALANQIRPWLFAARCYSLWMGCPVTQRLFNALFVQRCPDWARRDAHNYILGLISPSFKACTERSRSVIKRRLPSGLEIERRLVQGCARQVVRLRQATQKALGVINIAYIERLNATFVYVFPG